MTDAWTDFVLSRQAMQCTPATLAFYKFTVGVFLKWLEQSGVTSPDEIAARHVREYLAKLAGEGKSDTTIHDNARAIKTLTRFFNAEGYTAAPVNFDMPRVAKKRLPVLSAEELNRVIAACKNPRDKALTMFLADSGLRRAEVCALNWNDLDFSTGLVLVRSGKGRKARSAVIGSNTRRALLKYRRTLKDTTDQAPVFQARGGTRLTGEGVLLLFRRLAAITGIPVGPHALRRTFTILSLRGGMDSLYLQALGGWADLTMVAHYAQMVDDDLLKAHKTASPIDNLP